MLVDTVGTTRFQFRLLLSAAATSAHHAVYPCQFLCCCHAAAALNLSNDFSSSRDFLVDNS